MFSSTTKKAGHDFIHAVNKTHLEYGTRHVMAKTAGFRLFDIHAEGSGGMSAGGMTGIGTVGEVLIAALAIGLFIFCLRKCVHKNIRHESYKAYFRASNPQAQPPALDQYGPRVITRYSPSGPVAKYCPRETRRVSEEEGVINLVRSPSPSPQNPRSKKIKVQV